MDFIISFGGDGTLLNTVTNVGRKGIKILGVNVGKLGFYHLMLAEKLIHDIQEDNYTLEKRTLISKIKIIIFKIILL